MVPEPDPTKTKNKSTGRISASDTILLRLQCVEHCSRRRHRLQKGRIETILPEDTMSEDIEVVSLGRVAIFMYLCISIQL